MRINNQNMPVNPVKVYLLEYMDARRSLYEHVREYDRQMDLLDRIDDQYTRATKATSSMNALRVSGTPNHDSMAEAVMEIVRLKEKLGKAAKEGAPFDCLMQDALRLAYECEKRLALINRLRGEQVKMILFMRYVCGMGWDAIEHKTQIPIRTLFRKHGKALKFLNDYYFREEEHDATN